MLYRMRKIAHIMLMKSKLNRALVIEWKERVGGLSHATEIIMSRLGCSVSKADKIASGRYPSVPTQLERRALAKLMEVEESELFPAPTGKSRAS